MKLTPHQILREFEKALSNSHCNPKRRGKYVELLKQAIDEEVPEFCQPSTWGSWTLGMGVPLSLDYTGKGHWGYEVVLGGLRDFDGIAHWISHLDEKIWFQPGIEDHKYCDPDSALNFLRGIVSLWRSKLLPFGKFKVSLNIHKGKYAPENPRINNSEGFLNCQETAKALGTYQTYLAGWRSAKRFPLLRHEKIDGRIYYRIEGIKQFLQSESGKRWREKNVSPDKKGIWII